MGIAGWIFVIVLIAGLARAIDSLVANAGHLNPVAVQLDEVR